MKEKNRVLSYCSNKRLEQTLQKADRETLYTEYISKDLDRKDVCKVLDLSVYELDILLDYYKIRKDMSLRMKKTRARQLQNMTPEKAKQIKEKELKTKALKSEAENREIKNKELATKQKVKETDPESYLSIQKQRNNTHSQTLKNKSPEWWNSRYKKFVKSININQEENVKKCMETKRANNSFNKSKVEVFISEYLKTKYSVKTQHKDDVYPFYCDVYIEDLSIYIEINGYWTHNEHPFDANVAEDIIKLDKIKSKQKYYIGKSGNLKENSYFIAENVWTIKDPLKLKYAKNNKLTYIVLYNINEYNMKNICSWDFKKFANTGVNIIDMRHYLFENKGEKE